MRLLRRISEGNRIKITYTDRSEGAIKKLLEDERFKELVEGIELYDGVKLRPLSQEDIADLMTSPHLVLGSMRALETFVLEKCVDYEDPDYQKIHQIFDDGVLAMRLLKGGKVRSGPLFFIKVSGQRHLSMKSESQELTSESDRFHYELSLDEIPLLKRISEKIHGTDFSKLKSLRVACTRLERAVLERNAEDKLIDLAIGFEALFPEDERTELQSAPFRMPTGFIIASLCSSLLGRSGEEKEEIRYFIENAYRIRNLIVHGLEFKEPIHYRENSYLLSTFVSKIEDYLRRSIKKSLELD